MADTPNIHPSELAKFDALAERWWDPEGALRPLHAINPLRLEYIVRRATLEGARVLDVGCGGGLLTEAMAAAGAQVTGIDASEKPLGVARLHLLESGREVEYLQTTAEVLARQRPQAYDLVTCLEVLEHVPSPPSLVAACAELTRPGGDLFFATINRNPKSYLFAIIGAEYLLRLLPRGTHDWEKFIRPSELDAAMRAADLELLDIIGLGYNPLTRHYFLNQDPSVNYMVHGRREG